MTDIIIGSGPAGMAVAMALRARGREVAILDGGRMLDGGAETRRAALTNADPGNWPDETVAKYREGQFAAPEGEVRRFGSAFAMEPPETSFAATGGLALRASRAVGGLSNCWGSAVLPYRQSDIADWPIHVDDLAPHYRAVAGFMPVAGQEDALARLFPAFAMTGRQPIPPGPQARRILSRWRGTDSGVTLGLARQAVSADCRLCGLCLHGCPWGYIHAAGQTLATLQAAPGLRHLPGRIVRGFQETAGGIQVTTEDGETFAGERLFIAAGVLETARLLLASLALESLSLADSQHGFLPLIQTAGAGARPDQRPFHTLPQLFAEIDDPAISPRLVHAQLYTWNEYYARDLIANYGRIAPLRPVLRALAMRLVVAQIFLHSDHSTRAELRLAADGRLNATLHERPDTRQVLGAAARRLGRALRPAGLQALTFALRPGAAGSSFHAGATLPMAVNPQGAQSDVLGRPAGFSRVHVVDASVLPTIPATTITFSVMANAHRIASLAP